MNRNKLLVLKLVVLIVNSAFSENKQLKIQDKEEDLSEFICKITKDVLKSQNQINDILIGNMSRQASTLLTDGIAGCFRDNNSVVITDFKISITEVKMRKSAVNILIFDAISQDSIRSIIFKNQFSTVWNHMSKIICIITGSVNSTEYSELFRTFASYGYLDVAFVQKVGKSIVASSAKSLHGEIQIFQNLKNGNSLFIDKLRNLQGYRYRIVVHAQEPKVTVKNGIVTSSMVFFLLAVAKIQNGSAKIILLEDYYDFPKFWRQRQLDLTLNTATEFPEFAPKLLTYEERGYCALVPLPPKTSLTHMVMIMPFDGWTWLAILITVVASAMIWKMFRGRGAVDSHWLIAFGFVVMFIGQGVEFSRQNRCVLKILLQLIILMVFVLNQAYEGVITSFMIQPTYENRFETFEDIIASDYKIMTDPPFIYGMKSTKEFSTIISRINASAERLSDQLLFVVPKQEYVFIATCDLAELFHDLRIPNGKKVSEYYYLMPSIIMPYFVRLEASFLNPFLERLQHYMDLSFEAGLPYIWKVLTNVGESKQTYLQPPGNVSYLKFNDLIQVFGLLAIGYVISTVVFLIEIFFHGCLRNMMFGHLAKKLKNKVHQLSYDKKGPANAKYRKGALYYIIRQHKKVKRLRTKKIKVRKIFVRPIN